MDAVITIIAIVVTLVVAIPVTWTIATKYRIKVYESKIGTAEEKSREIIDEALKAAEAKKREALLEVKEETLRSRNECERETKERRAELQRYERRVLNKEENIDKKADALERRETAMAAREESLSRKHKEVETVLAKQQTELERISGLTSEQAKDYLLKTVENDVKHDTAKMIKELENRAREGYLRFSHFHYARSLRSRLRADSGILGCDLFQFGGHSYRYHRIYLLGLYGQRSGHSVAFE